MRSRPVGITLTSILGFVATAQYAVLAVLAVVNKPALVAFLHTLSPGGSGPEKVHLAMGPFEPVYYAAMMLFIAFVAHGLWTLRNWTRLVILAMTGISLVGLVLMLPGFPLSANTGAWALWMVRMALCLLWASYLMSRHVRQAFRTPAVPSQAQAA